MIQTWQGCVVKIASVNGVGAFMLYDTRVPSLQSPNPIVFTNVEGTDFAVACGCLGKGCEIVFDDSTTPPTVQSIRSLP